MRESVSVEQRGNLLNGPDVIGHASRHSGRRVLAECRHRAHEVVGHEVQTDRCRVVLDLLGEPVGQAGERRMPIRIERLFRSTMLVEILSGSGRPERMRTVVSVTSFGE